MKAREGFISNSSSTSFVVLGKKCNTTVKLHENVLVADGFYEFGCAFEKFEGFESKLAFAYLQCKDYPEFLDTLEKVIIDYCGCSCVVWNIDEDSYVDHQSLYPESKEFEMNYEYMKLFLFSNESYFKMGNDND